LLSFYNAISSSPSLEEKNRFFDVVEIARLLSYDSN